MSGKPQTEHKISGLPPEAVMMAIHDDDGLAARGADKGKELAPLHFAPRVSGRAFQLYHIATSRAVLCITANFECRGPLWVMYGRRPRCKRNLTIISEAFGCGHVFGLRCSRLAAGPDVIR